MGTGGKGLLVALNGQTRDKGIPNDSIDYYDLGQGSFGQWNTFQTNGSIPTTRVSACTVLGSFNLTGQSVEQHYVISYDLVVRKTI